MSIPNRIREYLAENHVFYWRKIHPIAFTAQEVASLEHIPGREIAKTVVLKADGRMILAVLPADRVINMRRLAAGLACKKLMLASETEFAEAFPDCDRGAMPPFGRLFGLPLLCDRMLAREFEIEFNAGTHKDMIRMSFAEFDILERPVILDFSTKSSAMRMAS